MNVYSKEAIEKIQWFLLVGTYLFSWLGTLEILLDIIRKENDTLEENYD